MASVCHDSSGYENHGEYRGTEVTHHPSIIANESDKSAIFGGNTYVDASAVIAETPPYNFSFGCWFFAYANYTGASYGAGILVFNTRHGGDGPWGGEANRILLRFGGTATPWVPYLDLGDGSRYVTAPAVIPEDPHFVVVNVHQTYIELFSDGVSRGTHSIVSGHHIQSTDRFSMGQEYDDSGPTDFFEGVLDEVFVMPRTLTPAEIANLYDIGRGAIAASYFDTMLGLGPVGYWRMNDAPGGWFIGQIAMR